jgi:uncharacterized protein (UPF0332 family)
MTRFAQSQWDRALDSLDCSRQVLESHADAAASFAYYAAFYVVSAVFAVQDKYFVKHTAVQAAVHRDLVPAGGWPASIGKDFDELMDKRNTGTYGGTKHVSTQQARESIDAAQRIIDYARTACPQIVGPNPSEGEAT